jgi:hypothetical protein
MINNGIDQQVQRKADAYRGNSQALQKRYAQNKQLIDLLALQKLKTQQDDVARNMQLQMQQQPGTVKDQLEAEMLNRTKQDMMGKVGQVAGVLNKKQADQQKRASQMGIATAPAPNMARMANGGIINYAKGDLVDADDASGEARRRYAELLKKARPQGKSFNIARLSDAEKAEFETLNNRFERQPITGAIGNFLNRPISDIPGMVSEGVKALSSDPKPRPASEIMTVGQGTASGTGEEMNAQRVSAEDLAKIAAPRPSIPTEDETDYLQESAPTGSSAVGAEAMRRVDKALGGQEQPSGGIAGLQTPDLSTPNVGVPAATATLLDASKYNPDYSKADALRGKVQSALEKDIAINPDQVEQDAYERSLGRIGYTDDEKALRQKRIDQLQSIYDKRMDPQELRNQEARAFAQRAATTTGGGIGSALAQGSMGRDAARRRAQQAEVGGLKSLLGAETDLMKELSAQRKEASAQGITKAGQAELRRGRGITGIMDMSTQEAQRADKAADRLLSMDVANMERDDRQRAMTLKAVIANTDKQFQEKVKVMEYELGKEKNAITRAYYADSSLQGRQKLLGDIQTQIANVRQKYDEFFTQQIQDARTMPPSGMDETQLKTYIEELEKQRKRVIDESTKELVTMVNEIRVAAGGMGIARQK